MMVMMLRVNHVHHVNPVKNLLLYIVRGQDFWHFS